jgi:Zn-dependent protease with chaperone function
MSLAFASILTLTYFAGSVLAVLLAIAYATNATSLGVVILLTILFNFVVWLVSPVIQDFMMRWFYSMRFLEDGEARAQPWWGFVERVCGENKIKPPRFGVIDDANPTAFTYGSTANRARVILTRGIVSDLAPRELEAVIAHELGHVVNRDFIVMTIASTLLQILYQLYVFCTHFAGRGSGDKKNQAAAALYAVGIGALVLYFLGTYLLLYLSRTREYLADEFSAKATGDGNLLSDALLKVAYGIAASPDTEKTAHLLRATRAQGLFDVQQARGTALVSANAKDQPATVERALLFDMVSPWAWIVQLRSTHPLIGKRLERLMTLTQRPRFDFERIKTQEIDRARLYAGFWRDATIWALPWVAAIAFVLMMLLHVMMPWLGVMPTGAVVFVAVFAVGVWLRLRMRYPSSDFPPSDVMTCLSDVYASPVRGKPVSLSGAAIGRGQAGYILSSDMMFRDRSGLIFLNYESGIPIFGNLYFAWKKLEPLIGQPATAKGWFLRGVTHHLELTRFEAAGQVIKSRVFMWSAIGAAFAIVLAIIVGVGAGAIATAMSDGPPYRAPPVTAPRGK